MLIYNKIYLDNLRFLRKASEWYDSGLIKKEEYVELKKHYRSPYKSYHLLARLGLFIITPVGLLCMVGMANLILMQARVYDHQTIQYFLWGTLFYIFAEASIKRMEFYQTGVRGALLYSAVCALCWGIISLVSSAPFYCNDRLIYFSCMLPIIVLAAVRFADSILFVCGFACALCIDALLILKMGTIGKMLLPFESMAFSCLFYYLAGRLKSNYKLHYYKNCITLVETAGIITFYLSGSYAVVRMLTEKLLGVGIDPGSDIRLAFFFYAFTILIPLMYIWLGLKQKNHVFFWAGILLEAGGILGIRYYHALMPPEYALTLGGTVITLLSYFSIRYLRVSRYGITFKIYKSNDTLKNITNIVSSEVGSGHHTPKTGNVDFGGGNFGGGGAGADY